MKQELLSVKGGQVDYTWVNKENSSKDKPTLVFLHEGLGCIQLWRDFPAKLCSELNMRGFVYSRFGYGNSDPCKQPRPLTYMHDEAIEILPSILEAAGIGPAILVGHSDGGSIALIHAGTVANDMLKGVVTLAAHVFSEKQCYPAFMDARSAYQEGNLREKLRKYHGENVDCAFYGWHDAWMNPEFEFWNLEEYLPSIKTPTLVLQGIDDQYGTVAQVEAIDKGIGHLAQSCMIEDCGHAPHLEQPDETLEQIVGFIKSIS